VFNISGGTDDGQLWYGHGTYTEYKHKIITDAFSVTFAMGDSTKITLTAPATSHTFLKKGDDLVLKSKRRKDRVVFTRDCPKK